MADSKKILTGKYAPLIGRKSYLAGRRWDTQIPRLRTTRVPRKTNDVRVRRRTTEIGAAEGGVRGAKPSRLREHVRQSRGWRRLDAKQMTEGKFE